MTSVEPLLTPIRERLAKATPGPWSNYGDLTHEVYPTNVGDEFDEPDNIANDVPRLADAEFIASAPNDMARLLAAVEAVLELADQWQENFPYKADRIRSAVIAALGCDK